MVEPPGLALASASPRRHELIGRIVDAGRVAIVPADVDEAPLAGEPPAEMAVRLARAKASAVAAMRPDVVVVGADTVVDLDGVSLGKPSGRDEARRLLARLSGRRHEVTTGLAVVCTDGSSTCWAETTTVWFRRLDPRDIDDYVLSGEPMDKAGGYGIQGGARRFVESIEGSYLNVVGLPLGRLAVELRRCGVDATVAPDLDDALPPWPPAT